MAEKSIKSPMPGTFYRRPDPESENFVNEGDEVSPGDTVGLVEVMKSFHEIKAEESGTVAKVLVEDEEPVGPGQDLIELR